MNHCHKQKVQLSLNQKLKLIKAKGSPKRDEKVTNQKEISTVDTSNNAIATNIGVINSN